MSSDPKHLEEILKARYETEFNRKETLDQKANSMMTIAATVATLYSGFGVAIVTHLFRITLDLSAPTIVLLIGVGALVAAIFFGARAYKLSEYQYAFPFNQLINNLKKDGSIEYNNQKINEYLTRDTTDFSRLMSKIYTKCIKLNFTTNDSRSKNILRSQLLFQIGLFTFIPFILTTIFNVQILDALKHFGSG